MASWPFDHKFWQQLERLRLSARPIRSSSDYGDRKVLHRGFGSDFFDFRPYVPGDDLRYVDWNMFARLDRLILKVFQAEGVLCLHLLIDTSRSMQLGSPSKLDYALRSAAALAFIGLVKNDYVALGLFDRTLSKTIRPKHGRKNIAPLLALLADVKPGGVTDIEAALTAYARQSVRTGIAIVLSDFLDTSSDFRVGLSALLRRGFEVRVLQVLAVEEVNPDLEGNLTLVDIETGDEKEVVADSHTLADYRSNVQTFQDQIEAYCLRHGITYHAVTTETSFDVLFSILGKRGFVQ